MTKRSIFIALITLGSLNSLSAQTFGNWQASEGNYDLDPSIDACIAKTSTKHNDLTLIFPKNRKALPLIKLTNKFDREYLGARFRLDNGRKAHFFGTDRNGQLDFYMMPRSGEEIKSFIKTVRAKSKTSISKFYLKNGRLTKGDAGISLKGSTNATDQLKKCLGSESFVSSFQSKVIEDLSSYQGRVSADEISYVYNDVLNRGSEIFQQMQDYFTNKKGLTEAKKARDAKRNDPEFQELRNKKSLYNQEVREQNSELTRISDNENFLSGADQTIRSLEERIKSLNSNLLSLDTEKANLEAQVARADEELSSLNSRLSLAQDNTASKQELYNQANNNLNSLQQDLSAVESQISNLNNELADLRAQTFSLQEAQRTARRNYNNRHQLENEIRQGLYNQYGGDVVQLENQVNDLTKKKNQAQRISSRAVQAKGQISDIATSASQIVQKQLLFKQAQKDLQCFTKANGKATIPCIQAAKKGVVAERSRAQKLSAAWARKKCRFPGRKKCKRKRAKIIAASKVRINNANAQIAAFDARIKTIQTTGKDPQRKQDIQRLKTIVNRIKTERDQVISETQQQISRLDLRGLRNRFPVFDRLKSCAPKSNRPCLKVSERASTRVSEIAVDFQQKYEDLNSQEGRAQVNLTSLKEDIDKKVNGLERKLAKAQRIARRNLSDNQNLIAQKESSASSLFSEQSSLSRSLSSASSDLQTYDGQLRDARREESIAQNSYDQYRSSIGYDQLLSDLNLVTSDYNTASSSLSSRNSELRSVESRKTQIQDEVSSYPQRRENAKRAKTLAQEYLSSLEPLISGHESELRELNSVLNNSETNYDQGLRLLEKNTLTIKRTIR